MPRGTAAHHRPASAPPSIRGCGDTQDRHCTQADRRDGADFVLDDFTVTDLGPAEDQSAACSTLALTAGRPSEPGRPNKVEPPSPNYETAEDQGRDRPPSPDTTAGVRARGTALDPGRPRREGRRHLAGHPPADAKYQPCSWTLESDVPGRRHVRAPSPRPPVRTLPPPPTTDTYASDPGLDVVRQRLEPSRRTSPTGNRARATAPLKIGGVSCAGARHPRARRIRYYLGGRVAPPSPRRSASTTSRSSRGSVQFSVTADGTRKVKSPGPQGHRHGLAAVGRRQRRHVRRPDRRGRRRRQQGDRRTGERPLPLRSVSGISPDPFV